MQASPFSQHIHLLYVPTLACNLACRYCYLGDQTRRADLKQNSSRAAETLRQALDAFIAAGVLPFNVSLHGGEPSMLPPPVLEELFSIIHRHYLDHFDHLTARGYRKSSPHIKTNLFNFHTLYGLYDRHRVSISASIDLPLSLHGKYRTTKAGKAWLKQTLSNLRLLARYPHAAKISATLYREHLEDIPALIADIWTIHREIGFDMNNFNIMFGFESSSSTGLQAAALHQVPDTMQAEFYETMRDEFMGSGLEEGFLRNWFDEFKPSYCTNAFNCGERFLLLQSDGEIYSCVRGQGLDQCRYGNILRDSVPDILAAGRSGIALLHQQAGFDDQCRACEYLHICHTGCPVVKLHSGSARSYSCALQKAIYRDNACSYPAAGNDAQQALVREYIGGMHPARAFETAGTAADAQTPGILLPNDLAEEKNALARQIDSDPVLQVLYSEKAIVLEINDELQPLRSQILKQGRQLFSFSEDDRIALHLDRSFFEASCPEPIRNTLYLQLLRDTTVVYGDEQRHKQEHLFTHQIFFSLLKPSARLERFVAADLSGLLRLHREMYLAGVLNNLFITTGYLREYHYQKQRANAFYHIQAINLPFQNLEFYWDR